MCAARVVLCLSFQVDCGVTIDDRVLLECVFADVESGEVRIKIDAKDSQVEAEVDRVGICPDRGCKDVVAMKDGDRSILHDNADQSVLILTVLHRNVLHYADVTNCGVLRWSSQA